MAKRVALKQSFGPESGDLKIIRQFSFAPGPQTNACDGLLVSAYIFTCIDNAPFVANTDFKICSNFSILLEFSVLG